MRSVETRNWRVWSFAVALACGIGAGLDAEGVAADPATEAGVGPNIVWIVSDDQGYADLGCFGSRQVKTPNLDRLAAGGVRLTNFYVSWPACTPSRGSLLTGRYPQRNGIYDMIRNEAPDYGYRYSPEEYEVTFERIGGMDTREILLPELLRQQGYRTAIFGKWDLGSLRRFLPTSRGFDEFYGFVNTGIDYFTHERYGVPSMYRDDRPTQEDRGTYCTQLFEREAVRFLRRHHAEPFFLYIPFNAPHSASNLDPVIRSAPQGTDAYKALYPELQAGAGLQSATRYGKPAQVRNRAGRRLEYCAAVTEMDAAIGRILDVLDEFDLTDSTMIVFLSDNGGSGIADNGPLRGHKAQMWEGGVRVPAIVRFPPRIPAGQQRDQFLSTLDLLPTTLAVTGSDLPSGLQIDGFDMWSVLATNATSPRTEMFWKRRGDRAARVGNWKWVDAEAGGGLFDLTHDVGESRDLSQQHPDILAHLQERYGQWLAEMERAEPRGPFRNF
ncbi:MAG: N-acetylgalactosamine-6-sulfatase [Planctomycetota bacterium]|nr:MAG: N-acetylgalactosamine-6-sulfatase [Planctomycetota bacterium]